MIDQSIYINMISSDACGGVRTMAFPFGKNGMANPLDILVLRKERQNELFERKIKTCPSDFVAVVKQAALRGKRFVIILLQFCNHNLPVC